MIKEECKNCKFYFIEEETVRAIETDEELHPDDYESECRRFPPVRGDSDYYGKMINPYQLNDYYGHPVVKCKAWCGEWRKRA